MEKQKYLLEIDRVIEQGIYKDDWQSLADYKVPEWFSKGKFGIFIHWGVYSVPAAVSEWYPRNMYREGTETYEHHVKTYGHPKEFGYKDFIPMFEAKKFDPKAWAQLFKASGARYVMPVGEHHDGFQMYNSSLSPYNSVNMGPHRDILGELKCEIEKEELVFTTSSHRAEHWWFLSEGLKFDSGVTDPEWAALYGPPHPAPEDLFDLYQAAPDQDFLEDWLVRTCEMVDNYQPQALYFDWWIENVAFKPYLKKFTAYYYNRAKQWGKEVAIYYKMDAFPKGTAVEDFERSQLPQISPYPWQSCTSVAKNSWCYTVGNNYKTSEELIGTLVDIVSKNGNMLLNIGPKADGTIPQEDANILKDIGKWLFINGEAIYDTRHWRVFGEGPTEVVEGFYNDHNRKAYTSEDIRFTMRGDVLYAFVMKWPKDGVVKIKALGKHTKHFNGIIEDVSVLGSHVKPQWIIWEEGLTIKADGVESNYPVCLKLKLL